MSSNSPPSQRMIVRRTFVFSMYSWRTSVVSIPSTTNMPPCLRSSSGPKTKLESGRGQQSHSTDPSLSSALYEQLPMMPRLCVMGE